MPNKKEKDNISRFSAAIPACLTPDLVLKEWRFLQEKSPLGGHCYVATESMYYLLGGKDSGFMPASITHEGIKHYYLKHRETGEVVDLTAGQFATPISYEKGRGSTYRQGKPSKRSAILIDRVQNKLANQSRK